MTAIWIGAIVIGLAIGMLGSGGSALTVPILVYLVGHNGKVSITESMAIVGLISVAAAIPYGRTKQIDWRSVIYFGIPGMVGTFLGAWLGGIASEALQLVTFGIVLLFAAYAMLGKDKPDRKEASDEKFKVLRPPIPKVATEGTIVGIVTGFVGVGGGFLIVPALVILGRLPMRLAIGTSLIIVAAKSAVGFAKYQHYLIQHDLSVDVQTITLFTLIGIIGSLMGRAVNQQLNQHALKRVFAVFLILLGGFVIVREGSKLLVPSSVQATTANIQLINQQP